eukprot:265107_1
MSTSHQLKPYIFPDSVDDPQKMYLNIGPHLHIIMYFYPFGKEDRSLPGYSAVSVKFKSDRNTFNGAKIQWVFECGKHQKQSPVYLIDSLIHKEECVSFNHLFRFSAMDDSPIQFITTVITNKSTRKAVAPNANRKQDVKQLDHPTKKRKYVDKDSDDTNASKKRKIDTSVNRQNDEKCEPLDWNIFKQKDTSKHIKTCDQCEKMKLKRVIGLDTPEVKLNPQHLIKGIRTICKALDISPCMPDVDCFGSNGNHQDTWWYITDFVSGEYDCATFWSKVIAWSHPPKDQLIDTIKAYEKRQIKGYLCGPCYLNSHEEGENGNEWYSYAQQHHLKHSVNIGSDDSNCDFEMIICYFDFQENES